MSKVRAGKKRLMITLPIPLIQRLEQDTLRRGLGLTKSVRIQLAIERELDERAMQSNQQNQTKRRR